MIQVFIDRFIASKDKMLADFKAERPEGYSDLVKSTIQNVTDPESNYGNYSPDPDRIHKIDDGDWQGTLVFVVAAKGYQPSDYWYLAVGYGSCSACDTFEAIGGYSDEPVTDEQAKKYWDLCLHMIQGLKKMGDE